MKKMKNRSKKKREKFIIFTQRSKTNIITKKEEEKFCARFV